MAGLKEQILMDLRDGKEVVFYKYRVTPEALKESLEELKAEGKVDFEIDLTLSESGGRSVSYGQPKNIRLTE